MEALLADGEPERALVLYLREVVSLPAAAIDQLRSASTCPSRVAAAHTVRREYSAAAEYTFDGERFAGTTTPTLLMTSEASFPWARAATDAVDEVLPNSRLVELEGQGHIGYATAPDRFTDALLGFVGGSV
jgi:pimeloyl-ACP methyl ester carboxylesterase